MQRTVAGALVAIGLLALGVAGAGAAAPTAPKPALTDSAPADEYFGPFKYSAISVRTKIDALGRSYLGRWQDDASLLHDAGLLESSYQAWAQRYPRDPWLAPTAFHLAQLYFEIQTPEARTKAKAMFDYVARTFPKSKQGHLARLRLHQGFPALHTETAVAPTPSPYGSTQPSPAPVAGSPQPSPSGASAPVPSSAPASAAPAASAKPSAAPKPSPAAKP